MSIAIPATNTSRLSLIFVLTAWLALRAIEFVTGFVPFSAFRLLLAIAIPLLLSPMVTTFISQQRPVQLAFERFQQVMQRRWALAAVIILFAVLGYLLFFSRNARGANMADTPAFKQSVVSTAEFKGILENDAVEGSQFKSHNNPFLFGFVPLIWLFGPDGWYIAQFTHSLVIVLWAYVVARAASYLLSRPNWLWPLFVGLFLATYTQHASFYDTRFVALGLAVFAFGIARKSTPFTVLGFVLVVLSRETGVIIATALLVLLRDVSYLGRRRFVLIAAGVGWFLLSLVLARVFGGPTSFARFDPCVLEPSLTAEYVTCFTTNLTHDLPLKLGYTARLISFAPLFLTSLPAIGALGPEFALAWLSRDYVIYNLNWHYFMPPLTIIILLGLRQLQTTRVSSKASELLGLWLLATCIWQFVTLFNPRLL